MILHKSASKPARILKYRAEANVHPTHMSTSGIRHRGEHRPELATCQASKFCNLRFRRILSDLTTGS